MCENMEEKYKSSFVTWQCLYRGHCFFFPRTLLPLQEKTWWTISHTSLFASNHPSFLTEKKHKMLSTLNHRKSHFCWNCWHLYFTCHQSYNILNLYMKQIVKLTITRIKNDQNYIYTESGAHDPQAKKLDRGGTRWSFRFWDISTRCGVAFCNPGFPQNSACHPLRMPFSAINCAINLNGCCRGPWH